MLKLWNIEVAYGQNIFFKCIFTAIFFILDFLWWSNISTAKLETGAGQFWEGGSDDLLVRTVYTNTRPIWEKTTNTNTQYANTKILKFIQLHKYRLIGWYVPPTLLISGQNNNCDSILENGNFQQGRLIIVLATTWGASFVYHIRDCPNRWYKCITVECGLTACLCLSTTCSFSFLL